MRNCTETLFWNKLAGNTTDTISLILDSYESTLKTFDEFLKSRCPQTELFAVQSISTILHVLEHRGCVAIRVITIAELFAQILIFSILPFSAFLQSKP